MSHDSAQSLKTFYSDAIRISESHISQYLEFLYYFIFSFFALVIDFSILTILIEFFHINILNATATGFIFGAIFLYVCSVSIIFDKRRINNSLVELTIFVSIGVFGLILNQIIIYVFVFIIDFHYTFSKLISIGLVFLSNFSLRKLILFSK